MALDGDLMRKVNHLFGDRVGCAIALDVQTGEIPLFLSVPNFNPQVFVDGMSTTQWGKLRDDKKQPLFNRALLGRYSPGSLFKIITAAAALENGWDYKKKLTCSVYMDVGDTKFHCSSKIGHGPLNMIEAIAYSCNIYFYEIAQQCWI